MGTDSTQDRFVTLLFGDIEGWICTELHYGRGNKPIRTMNFLTSVFGKNHCLMEEEVFDMCFLCTNVIDIWLSVQRSKHHGILIFK